GAVQLYDVYGAALAAEIPRCDVRKLRRHAERTGTPPLLLPAGHAHPAAAYAQVAELIDIRRVLEQDVLSRDAHVRRAALDVYRDVRGLHPEEAQPVLLVFKNQLAAVLSYARAAAARALEH